MKVLELLLSNGGRFEIKYPLLAGDTEKIILRRQVV